MDKSAYTKKYLGKTHVYKNPLSGEAIYPESKNPKLKQKAKSVQQAQEKEKAKKELTKKDIEKKFRANIGVKQSGPWDKITPDMSYLDNVVEYIRNKARGKCQVLIGNRLFKVEAEPLEEDPDWSRNFGGHTSRVSFKEYAVKHDDCDSFPTDGFDSPAFEKLKRFHLHTNVYEIPLRNLVEFIKQGVKVWPDREKMVKEILPILAESRGEWANNYCSSCGKYNPSDAGFPELCKTCEEKGVSKEEEDEDEEDEDEEDEEDEEKEECYICNEAIDIDDAKVFNKKYYCKECYDKEFANCDLCSKKIKKNDYDVHYHDDKWYCDNCFSDKYSFCEHCEEYEPSEDFTKVGYQYFCDTCASKFPTCPVCEEKINTTIDSMFVKHNDEYYNSKCFLRKYPFECAVCSEPIREGEEQEYNDEFICEKCSERINNEPIPAEAPAASPETITQEPISDVGNTYTCPCGEKVIPTPAEQKIKEQWYPNSDVLCNNCKQSQSGQKMETLADLLKEKLGNNTDLPKKNAGVKDWFGNVTENWREESELKAIRKALAYVVNVLRAAKTPLGKTMIRGNEKFMLEQTRKLLGDASISFEIPMDPKAYKNAVDIAKHLNELDPDTYETSKGVLNLRRASNIIELIEKFAVASEKFFTGDNYMREIALTHELPDILNELADFYTKSVADMSDEDAFTWGGERKQQSEYRAKQLENLANLLKTQEQDIDDPTYDQFTEEEDAELDLPAQM